MTLEAVVVAAYGRKCLIGTEEGTTRRAVTRGRSETPVCNDRVEYTDSEGLAAIQRIHPRQRVFWRYDRRGGKRPLASHIDQVVIVIAGQPAADHRLLDRYIAAAEIGGQQVLLVWNKSDQQTVDQDLLSPYLALGYPIIPASAKTGLGLTALQQALRAKQNILLGLSGVGKSSLTNALVEQAEARTSALSDASGEGTHTTTAAGSYPLEDGILIDTPGVREYYLWPMPAAELQQGYIEIGQTAQDCRFNDCRHQHEPGCAVKDAVASGNINEGRYQRYSLLAEGLERQVEQQRTS